MEQLYDDVIKGKGSFIGSDKISPNHGLTYFGKNNKSIGLGLVSNNADRYTNSSMHELIHRAGVGSHERFARAGILALNSGDFGLTDEEKKELLNLPTEKSKNDDWDDVYNRFFSKLMNKACPMPVK